MDEKWYDKALHKGLHNVYRIHHLLRNSSLLAGSVVSADFNYVPTFSVGESTVAFKSSIS
jgi:hypothetical protein